jgi:hypothetical protein
VDREALGKPGQPNAGIRAAPSTLTTGGESPSARAAFGAAFALALPAAWRDSLAQRCPDIPPPAVTSSEPVSELEKLATAPTTNLPYDRDTAMTCSVVYEKLKAQKFNSDFCQMLAWRRQSKPRTQQAPITADPRPSKPAPESRR